MCEKLQITCVKLNQLKSIEGYDGQVVSKFIIHIIYSIFTVKDYKELTASIFITYFEHQGIILGSSWIIHHSIWPDLINHSIVFILHFCNHFEADYSQIWSLLKFLKDAAKEQKQQEFTKDFQENTSFKIYKINAAVYHMLIKQLKEKNIQLFFLSVCELDEKLKFLN